MFDTSGSMGAKLQRSRQAVAQFMKTANPQDEFFLVEFSDRPELVQGFTTQTEEIQNRLTFTQAKGRTALLDGVYMAMNQMKKAMKVNGLRNRNQFHGSPPCSKTIFCVDKDPA